MRPTTIGQFMGGIRMGTLQIEKNDAGTVNSGGTVIFDVISENTGNIAYDSTTGIITISENGTYVIDFWVSTQSSTSSNIIFSLNSNSVEVMSGNSPIKTGTTSGTYIFEVISAPITLVLQNSSDDTVFFSTTVPVKASLRLFSIITASADASRCFERSQLVNVLTQIVDLYPGAEIVIYGTVIGVLPTTIIQSLYTAPGSDLAGLLVITDSSVGSVYLNIDEIAAFTLPNSSYNNAITYLTLPDPFIENCETIMVPTIYNALTAGENRALQVSTNFSVSGNVYLNEYGMVVLAPTDGTNPTFVVPSKILYYY